MKKLFLTTVISLLFAGCNASAERVAITSLPDLWPATGNSFECSALTSTDVWRDPSENMNVVTTTKKGTDRILIKAEGESMHFNTAASVEAGMLGGAEFRILKNDSDSLIAAYLEETGYSMNTFVLNKATGLAVWTKSRPEFPATDAPTGDLIYLHCK